ncbi:MAG: prepilin-type N-terminal cleavage/methylation domain-containing protein [Proteobacteria bacterium]|nr:prepilin-type N-terminal cleavage/methylation domain-containing protein [Pseudomonadota bacterium]
MKRVNNEKGFTLVEIAIVLVIIGLLLGGVLKGQQLIANAKIKSLVNHANGLAAAVYAYQDRYKALPGDDPRAQTNLPMASGGCQAANLVNGNGNGQIGEYWAAAEHLACAGLITGTYNGTNQYITSPYSTNVIIYYETVQGKTGNDIRYYNLPADVAQAFDSALDDGVFNTGVIRASAAYTAGTVIASTAFYY